MTSTSVAASSVAFQKIGKTEPKVINQLLLLLSKMGIDEHWLVPTCDLRITPRILGCGSFGSVVLGTFHGAKVAVKLSLSAEASARLDSASI